MLKTRPKMNRSTLAGAAIAMAVADFFVWQLVWGGEKAQEYKTAEVTRGDLEVTISAAGKIAAKEPVAVGAQASGQLAELFFEAGDPVKKGNLLARIDAAIASTDVDAIRAQLRELQASHIQQQATPGLARSNAERATVLFKADAIARADDELAQAGSVIVTGRPEAIEAQIARQRSSLKAELATLKFTNIHAPIYGTVLSIEAVEGQAPPTAMSWGALIDCLLQSTSMSRSVAVIECKKAILSERLADCGRSDVWLKRMQTKLWDVGAPHNELVAYDDCPRIPEGFTCCRSGASESLQYGSAGVS